MPPDPEAGALKPLDPRAPLVLDTRELGRRPGSMRQVSLSVPAPAHLGNAVLGVAAGSPMTLELRLEAVMEGVLVSGLVRAEAAGECVRCLDPVQRRLEAEMQELYSYPDAASALTAASAGAQRGRGGSGEAADLDDEVLLVQNDLVDLEPAIRDAIVPDLPFQPTCTQDCPGLCPDCGQRLADEQDEQGHAHDTIDSRWAALAGLASPDAPDRLRPRA